MYGDQSGEFLRGYWGLKGSKKLSAISFSAIIDHFLSIVRIKTGVKLHISF